MNMLLKCRMQAKLLILCVLLVPHSCSVFTDCGSTKAKLLDVRVSRCEGEDVCPLFRGNNTLLEIDFQPLEEIQNVIANVNGKMLGVTLPFMGVKRKGCENSGLSCPLETGKKYTYNNTIDVKRYFPALEVDVIWKLMDKKAVIVCATIPAVLV